MSTLNRISLSQVAFDFAVTWALGLVGGPFSAVCAARMRSGPAVPGDRCQGVDVVTPRDYRTVTGVTS